MITAFQKENRFLSNFYPAKFTYGDIEWCSVEHAYQSLKFTGEKFKEAYALTNPYDIKKFANENKSFISSEFFDVKVKLMFDLVLEKFKQNPELKQKLLETGNQELIEGNTWNDTFWGVCNGQGQNWLGKILMLVRSELNKPI